MAIGGNPFGNSLQDMQNNWMQQYAIAQQQQQQLIQQPTVLDEINKEISLLSLDEQTLLGNTSEYISAKQIYEAGFLAFLGGKFSQEYISSQDGKDAAGNLLKTIRKSKELVHSKVKAKEEKVNALLDLVENDPEMKKKVEEIMSKKVNNG